jgi:gliding motility-associated-like protein
VTPSSGVVLTPTSPTSQFVGNTGVAYTLRWIITSGTCPPSIDDVIINFTASPTSTSPVTACVNTATPTLTATATGATSLEWYTDATLTNLVFTGASYTPAASELNMGTVASTTFFVIAKYSCGASPATQVVVNISNTGACGGGGGANCFAFATSDPVIEIRPSCSNQNDGQLIFGVKGGSGSYVITLYDSASNPIFTQAKIGSSATPITFASLSPSLNYFYKIDDGANTCVLPYSLPIKTTVQATATALVNAVCFGDSTGRATLTVTGGNSPYEYSIDGGATWITNFVSGNEINGLPPNGTYNILVRDDAGDLCPAEVPVTIHNANPRLVASFAITPSSCNGNDGALTNLVGSGGLPSSTYTFLVDGNVGPFDNLGGGSHTLKISDGTCSRDSIVDISFPGFIDFTLDSSIPATCSSDGVNTGALKIKFPFLGTYQVGLSLLQNAEPAAYETYTTLDVNDLLSIDTLSYGAYYIWVKKTGVECPTRKGPFKVDGVHAISFDFEPICIDGKVSLKLANVKADPDPSSGSLLLTIRDLSNSAIVNQSLGSYSDTYVLSAAAPEFAVFLSNPGRYNVQLTQIQPPDYCLVSASKYYTVTAPLSAQIKTSIIDPITPSASYPDEPTGAFDVINFAGGLEPYTISLTLETPTVPGQSYGPINDEEVLKNNNLQFEKNYSELPAGVYTVVVTDSIGCSIPLTAVVPLDMTIFIPNIFTPNDDGKNDLFFIRNLAAHSKLIINNRWGKEVFNTKEYLNDWTGEGLEDGIYYYRLESDSEVRKGWVEIIRGVKP